MKKYMPKFMGTQVKQHLAGNVHLPDVRNTENKSCRHKT